MRSIRGVVASVLGLALLVMAALALGGCASSANGSAGAGGSGDAGVREAVRVDLVVVAVDGERFAGTTQARWLQSFLSNEARDVDIKRSESEDLLGEAMRRLRGAPGYQFTRNTRMTVYTGARSMVSESGGAGAEMQIAIRPRRVGAGLYEVKPTISMLNNQSSGDGNIGGVTFRAPALRYGSVPLTVPGGETRAVRMRKEIGSSIRPVDLQMFAFAKVSPAE